MGVTLTPVDLILRAGPGHVMGAPYTTAAFVQLWRDTARITGMVGDGREILANRHELSAKLRALGVNFVEWERIKNGQVRVVRRRIGGA